MERLAVIGLLAPLLPLIGALWSRTLCIFLAGIGGLLWILAPFIGGDAALTTGLLAQLPLFGLSLWLSLRFGRTAETESGKEPAQDMKTLASVLTAHASRC